MRNRSMRIQAKRKFFSASLPTWVPSGTAPAPIAALPDHPKAASLRRILLKSLSYLTGTVPVFGGTGVINLFKKSIGVATVQLVTSFSLAAGITVNEAKAITFDAAVTVANRILLGTDALYATMVASSTVTTNPPAGSQCLTVEYEMIDVQGEAMLDVDSDISG